MRFSTVFLFALVATLAPYAAYGHDGYGHDGYGHDGYGHDGYGHDGYGHDGYGHDGYGHDGYGGDHVHDHDDHDGDVDGYHKSLREFHADTDGNVLHNNDQYDHIDDEAAETHLEHEKLHHHAHNLNDDLDERNFHEDILTPHEKHDVEQEVVETHHVADGNEPAHRHFGTMLDHGHTIEHLHDPAAEGQGHEVGYHSEGPANGHDRHYW